MKPNDMLLMATHFSSCISLTTALAHQGGTPPGISQAERSGGSDPG